jgi:hypothetical protein
MLLVIQTAPRHPDPAHLVAVEAAAVEVHVVVKSSLLRRKEELGIVS